MRFTPRPVALAVTASMLLMTACAPVDEGDETATDPASDDADAPESDEDVELDEDATLRWGVSLDLSAGFDPHRARSEWDLLMLSHTYDRLVHTTNDVELVPGLAEDWEYSDDGATLTLHLREDVTFHDGEVLDGEAVAANLERAMTHEASAVAGQLTSIEDIEVVDEHRVDLHLAGPDATLPGVLAGRAGAMISPAAHDDEELLAERSAGAGMFEVVEYRPGDIILQEPFEDYWDPETIKVGAFETRILPDDRTRLNALQTGELDVTWVASAYVDEAKQIDGVDVDPATSLAYMQMMLNRTKSELDDPRVRRALNLAIDREAILEGVFRGYGEPAHQPFPAEFWAHVPEVDEQAGHDPERAQELLAEAGLEDGFSLEVLTPPIEDFDVVGEVIQQQLEPLGIELQLRAVEPSQTAELFLANEEGDALVTLTAGQADPSLTTQLYVESFGNPGDHTTDEVRRLHELTVATVDEQEREELVHDLVREAVAEESFNVPLVFRASGYLTREEVVGFEPHGAALHQVRGVGIRADADR